jgi:hypothetical protein
LDETLDAVNESLQLSAYEPAGFINCDPAPPPHPGFQPVVEHDSHTHQVDFDNIFLIGTFKAVAPERFASEIANQARFLLSLSYRCIPRLLTVVERALGDDPPFATQRGDKSDFDTLVSDANRDHCGLSIQSRHFTFSAYSLVFSDVGLSFGHFWSKRIEFLTIP